MTTRVPDRALPDFLIIGAPKTGTTSLWSYLRSHPDVFMPEMKEPNFFLEEGNWRRGIDWYRSLFQARAPHQIAGEASPGYTAFPLYAGVPERIVQVAPWVKLIYLVREPVARMISSWLQFRVDGFDSKPLRHALVHDLNYAAGSQYATQLERFLEHFERDALLVLRTEDLASEPEKVVLETCQFLGVDPTGVRADLRDRLNEGGYRWAPRYSTLLVERALRRVGRDKLAYDLRTRSRRLTHRPIAPEELVIDDELRARLVTYLRPEIVRLRAIVGPDMDLWGYA